MNNWLESVYSDGTELFVSNPAPKLGETVTVRLRVYADAPVEHVLLRSVPNGAERLEQMQLAEVKNGLAYYEAPLRISENRMQYHFYLVCKDVVYFYNQKEITTYVPDHTYDFVLLADYVQPQWVKDAVFYQIFPERFCNGDPSNDVLDGEYWFDGFPTVHVQDWDMPAQPYPKTGCLDFYGGDLQGVTQKIPYLKKLGVTAVYLNPIFTAPSNHKYDCIDYFHVDPHFGGDEALAELSAALHANGMKLMLDISVNHTGVNHKWFNRDGVFFDKSQGAYNNPDSQERNFYFFGENNSYHGWFGVSSLPTLNYTSQALRDVIYQAEDSVLKKWLKPPYSIDGWRFDVADVMARKDEVQLSHELWPAIRRSIRDVNPQAYILAEDWGDCAPYLQGNEWDSPMNYYGCGRVIRQFLGDGDLFMNRNEILRNVHYKMTAQDVQGRVTEHLAKMPYALQQNQFNLFDTHDVTRLHTQPHVNREEYRGAILFQFMLPGAPNIYYGDEADIEGTDGRDEGCRYTMPWSKDFTNTENYRMYSTMANLKAKEKALSHGGMKFLYAEGGILSIARFYGDSAYVMVMSTEENDREIRLPLAAIGASKPEAELFGKEVQCTPCDKGVTMMVKAHQAYFMKVC